MKQMVNALLVGDWLPWRMFFSCCSEGKMKTFFFCFGLSWANISWRSILSYRWKRKFLALVGLTGSTFCRNEGDSVGENYWTC